jgi:CMP-N-acetylneuraminic acid synthetase
MQEDNSIVAFVPCRQGSNRVAGKNTRLFGGVAGGLAAIKLQQLAECPRISRIILSTDDQEVMAIGHSVAAESTVPIEIDRRPAHLAADSTSTDDLVRYVSDIIPQGVVLWTHVTSPFIKASQYTEAIETYQNEVEQGDFDSLMSVTKIQTFLWDLSGPINYDRTIEKWPATQSLPACFEVNSGTFMIEAGLMKQCDDRIGRHPFLHEMNHLDAFDIDTEDEFELASRIWHANVSL